MRWIVPLALSVALGLINYQDSWGQTANSPRAGTGAGTPRVNAEGPARPTLTSTPAAPRPAPRQELTPVDSEDPEAKKKLDTLLQQWEQRSSAITTLHAKFLRVDKSKVWDEEIEYDGVAILRSPNLAVLEFSKIAAPDPQTKKAQTIPHERIICTGQEVYQYRYNEKKVYIFPMNKDDRQRALEEGPLPFLFNMKAAEVKRRYKMTLRAEDAKSFIIYIEPYQQVDRESFSKAFIQLNKSTYLPDRLLLYDTNGKDTKDFRFQQIVSPKTVDVALFKGSRPKGWDVIYNPQVDAQPSATRTPPPDAAPRREIESVPRAALGEPKTSPPSSRALPRDGGQPNAGSGS